MPVILETPPSDIIEAAVAEANRSPCDKSHRGVTIFSTRNGGVFLCSGHNAQPRPFACDGSDACRAACAMLCEHAEQAAMRKLGALTWSVELLHVKTVDGELVPSGGPSCWECSKAILADRRIVGVWLFHEDGWRRYSPEEFHALTLAACELPDLRRPTP